MEGVRRASCSSSASSSSLVLYGIQRLQGHLFLNPEHFTGVAVAHLVQHGGQLRHEHELAVLRGRVDDVVPDARWPGSRCRTSSRPRSASRRMVALFRGFSRRSSQTLGNFWRDLYRALVYVLLPIAIVGARDPDRRRRAADVPRLRDGDDAPGRAPDDRARARSPRRSRSSTSARTAAASTTRTRPSRSRAPGSFGGYFELLPRAADPVRVGLHVRPLDPRHAATRSRSSPRCSSSSRSASGRSTPPSSTAPQVLRNSGVNITHSGTARPAAT